MNTFLFNYMFRHILVLYADRGLVEKGRPNLRLFNQLYWTISLTFIVLGSLQFPFIHIFKGVFERTQVFKMCIKQPTSYNEHILKDHRKGIMGLMGLMGMTLISPFLQVLYCKLSDLKIQALIRGICPSNRMACLGPYRRNLITMKQTSGYISNCFIWYTVHVLVTTYFSQQMEIYSTSDVFLIRNLSMFVFIVIYHGIIIPMQMRIPFKNTPLRRTQFYVQRSLKLSPRCYQWSPKDTHAHPQPQPRTLREVKCQENFSSNSLECSMKSEAATTKVERLQYISSDSESDSDKENDRDLSTQTVVAEVHRQDHGEPPMGHLLPPKAKTIEAFLHLKEGKDMPPVEEIFIPANRKVNKKYHR